MLDILFVVLFFTFPILVIKYMHKIGLNIFTISIPSILMVAIFIFAYIGVLPLYFEWDSYRVSLGITNKEILLKIFIFNCITILGLLFGFHFSKNILKLNIDFNIKNIVNGNKIDFIFLISIFILCVIVFLIYLSKIDEIALFVRIYEGLAGADIARSNMTNAFPGKYHWYNLVMNNILTIVTLSFFILFLQKKKYSGYLFLLSFLLTSFITVMATEKAPFFWFLISLFMTYMVVKHKGKVSIKYTLIVVCIIFILLTILHYYMYWASEKDILYAIKTLVSRVFTASIQPSYHYIEFFPAYHDFLYGRSFPNPKGILPFETYNLTQEIMNFAQPQNLKSGIVGSMPTIFWAEAYANFGLIGIFTIPFNIGIIVWTISFLISKLSNTPIKIGLYVWLILHFKNLSITGFSGYILDFYLILTTLTFLFIIILNKKFNRVR